MPDDIKRRRCETQEPPLIQSEGGVRGEVTTLAETWAAVRARTLGGWRSQLQTSNASQIQRLIANWNFDRLMTQRCLIAKALIILLMSRKG